MPSNKPVFISGGRVPQSFEWEGTGGGPQPQPQNNDGWLHRAWSRGLGTAERTLGTTVEELPQAIVAPIVQGVRQQIGLPYTNTQEQEQAATNQITQAITSPVAQPWSAATHGLSQRMVQGGMAREQAAGTPETTGETITNTPTSFGEVPGYLAGLGKFAAERTVESAPTLLAGAIASRVNPTLGKTVLGGLTYGQEYGGIRQAQQEQGVTDYGLASGMAAGATALDLMGGASPAVLAVGKPTLARAARGVAKEAFHVAKGEAVTETAQTLLERVGGHQDLTSKDAIADYLGSAIAGAGGGFVIGGGTGMLNRSAAAKIAAKAEAAKAKTDNPDTTAEQAKVTTAPDSAGGVAAGGTSADITEAPKAVPQVLPTDIVKGLFNADNVTAALANTGASKGYLGTLTTRLTNAFQSNNEKEMDAILRSQDSRIDPAHPSIKSDEDLARNQTIHGAVNQLIGNFREFHGGALQEEEQLTGPSPVQKYVAEKNAATMQQMQGIQDERGQMQQALANQQQELAIEQQAQAQAAQAAHEQELAAAAKQVENIHRQGILQTVISDQETRDPVKRFTALLKRNNFDLNVTPEEAKALQVASAKIEARTAGEAAKSGLSVQEYKDALPARAAKEAANLNLTSDQYLAAKGVADQMGISVPAVIQMQQEQALTPAVPVKAPPPYFQLEAQQEPGKADIEAMDKAQAKRDRRAEREATQVEKTAERDREQMSFLTEGAPATEVVENKKVVTPAKTGIKQRYDVGKKAAEAFAIKERADRAKAEAEALAKEKAKPAKKVAEKKVPTKRPALPKDQAAETVTQEAAKPEPKEKKRAPEKRKKPEGRVSERVRADEERQAAEASRGNRPERGGPVKEKAQEEKVTEPEEPKLTHADVLKEAESYLADDGESGLLKPTEYQQLSMLAEQGKMSPEDLKDRLDAVVNSRSEKAITDTTQSLKRNKSSVQHIRGVINASLNGFMHATYRLSDAIASLAGHPTTSTMRLTDALRDKAVINHMDPMQQELAKTLADVIDDDVNLATGNRHFGKEDANTLGYAVFPAGNAPGVAVRKLSNADNAATLLHEGVHIALTSKFGRNLTRLKNAVSTSDVELTRMREEASDLVGAYNKMAQVLGKGLHYGMKNIDEFVAEGLTNPKFQKFLDKGNLWTRFVDFVRKAIGLAPKFQSQLEVVLRAGANLIEGSKDFDRLHSIDVEPNQSETLFKKSGKTVADEHMTDELAEPANNVGTRFLKAADQNLSVYGFTENLIEDAQKLIPSVKKYLNSMRDRMQKKEEMVRHIDNIRSKFVGLGLKRQGVGEGTLNGFLQDSVESGKWGFAPSWVEDVEVDPEMEARFKALPANEQAIIKDALKTSYDVLKQKIDTVIDSVNNTYETLMLQAMEQNNEKKLAKLELEQKNALAEYRGLFAARKNVPYVTTRRFGDYMVVAKSQDMHAAQDLGDKKLIEEMKADPNHYFVQRYDTQKEADEDRAKILKADSFKGGTVISGEVDKTYQQFVGNRDMMLAYDRLRKLIQNQVEALDPDNKVNAKVIANMERIAVDLQLLALRQTSARKSELKKLGVGGGDMDMMRNFVVQGAADAHMISSLMYSKKVDEAIEGMRKEAFSDFSDDPKKARRFYNEMMLRHASGMAYERSEGAELIKSAASMVMLSLSPSYYLTNLTQPWVLSVPYMAGEHSYAKVNAEMLKSYGEVAQAWKDTGVTDPLDLSLVSDDVRDAIEELANRGRIDIGVDKEIGEFHSLKEGGISNAFDKGGTIIRALSQKVESINRVSTAAAAYRLAKDAGKTHEQAVDYADKVIRLTHGTYDGFNAPRWMRGPVPSIVTQFKKFQLMQVTLLWKLAKNSMAEGNSPEAKMERAVARRQLWFTMWHTMGLAGLKGMPGVTALLFLGNLIKGAMSDDDEPADIEKDIREAVGNEYADLLMTGAPSLAGIDISDRVGMGQIFSILPYTDVKFSKEGFYTALAGLLGPGAALVGKAGDAANALYKYGDYYAALGKLLPNGLDDVYTAMLEANRGVQRGGEKVIDPKDISEAQTFARAMGIMTTERSTRLREQNQRYNQTETLKNRSHQITRDYIEAKDAGDTAGQEAARQAWLKMQDTRRKLGEPVQPLSTLIRSYKTRNTRLKATVKGVQYTPKSAALRQAQEEAAAEE